MVDWHLESLPEKRKTKAGLVAKTLFKTSISAFNNLNSKSLAMFIPFKLTTTISSFCLLSIFPARAFGMEFQPNSIEHNNCLLAYHYEKDSKEKISDTRRTFSIIANLDQGTLVEYERLLIAYQKALRANGEIQAQNEIIATLSLIDVRKKLLRAWKPTSSVNSYSISISFNLNNTGYPVNIEMVKSSGDTNIDNAALQALKSAAPYLATFPPTQKVHFSFNSRDLKFKSISKYNSNNLNSICEEVLHGPNPSMDELLANLMQALNKHQVSIENSQQLYEFGSKQLQQGNTEAAIVILGTALSRNEDANLTKPISEKLLQAINSKILDISNSK